MGVFICCSEIGIFGKKFVVWMDCLGFGVCCSIEYFVDIEVVFVCWGGF